MPDTISPYLTSPATNPLPQGSTTGTVSFFDDVKGFGFVLTDAPVANDRQRVFFHRSALPGLSWRPIVIGTRLRFDVIAEGRGPRAVNIAVLEVPHA